MKSWGIFLFYLLLPACFSLYATATAYAAASYVKKGNKNKNITLGISAIGIEHNWDLNAYLGAREKARELGMKVLALDGQRKPEKQIRDIRVLIKRKVDVIAVVLGETDSLTPVLKEACDAGIPIVSADFENPYSLCNVSTDNKTAMTELVEHMVADLNQKGEIGVFYTPGIPIAELRYDIFKQVLGKYPEIKVVWQDAWKFPNVVQDAHGKTLKALSLNPEIDAFWSIFDLPMIGAAQAIKEKKLADQIKTYGFDGDPTAMKMLLDSESAYAATVAQQPYRIGEELAMVAQSVVQGIEVQHFIFVDHIFVNKKNASQVFNSLPQYQSKKYMLRSNLGN